MVRKSPGFTAAAIITLALGIGVNVAVFSVFDSFLFRLLPVQNPSQLVTLSSLEKDSASSAFSYPDVQDIKNQTASVFSGVSAVAGGFQTDGISVDGKNDPILTSYVDGDYFGTLGVQPALGRLILPAEGKVPGADPVLVLGYSYWQTAFAGDPNVVGKRVAINGHPVTIVGVAQKGFQGIRSFLDVQGYLPLAMMPMDSPGQNFMADRGAWHFEIVARLRPGVTLARAQRMSDVVAARMSQQYPATDRWTRLQLGKMGPIGPIVGVNPIPIVAVLFLTLAGLVLLLACLNIANLFLARSVMRRREMALRVALGARRRRLIAQSLTETLVLALIGGGFGMVLGAWTSALASSTSIGALGTHLILNFRFDWRVFAYALGAAVLAGAVMGLVPALRGSRVNLNDFLHDGGHAGTDKRQRTRNTLVVGQVAVSLMLLIVAGLFMRSLSSARHADLGFQPAGVLNLVMNPNQAGYNEAQSRQFLANLLDRVRSAPGIESASLANTVPLGGENNGAALQIEGYQAPRGGNQAFARKNIVSSQYFATMGIPILRGRGILDADTQNTEPVAVINQGMAAQFWPGQDPIGKFFTELGAHPVTLRVVGVVKNSLVVNLLTPSSQPYFYSALSQDQQFPVTLQIRTADPSAMTPGVLNLIRAIAPTLPVFGVQTMSQAVDTFNGLLLFKIAAAIAGSLGILGLVLAIVGVYGVVSYSASQRVREIGIRTALGAQSSEILRMILWQGSKTVGAGLIAGIVASLALARFVGSFLVGVSAFDPITYLCVSALLAATALLACYIPARHAMRVDPMVALRHE